LVSVVFLAGCTAGAATGTPAVSTAKQPTSPADFGARQITSPYAKNPALVWSLDKAELQLDGIKPGAPPTEAKKRYGKPSSTTTSPDGTGGTIFHYTFGNGLHISARHDQIYVIEFNRADAAWTTTRGIANGDSCDTVLTRFGPSHEGGSTYVYYAPRANSLVFYCKENKVVGVQIVSDDGS
jgi:hypothetical protein